MSPETIAPIQDVLNRWILAGQALVGSVGALAFVLALAWIAKSRLQLTLQDAAKGKPNELLGLPDREGSGWPRVSYRSRRASGQF